MTFRLIDKGWRDVLDEAMSANPSDVCVVCPFIKHQATKRFLGSHRPDRLRVITRFSLDDFAGAVSDLSALQLLLDRGASVRGVKHLHAKMFLFGDSRAVVTSANLTKAALDRNHEFGFVAEDAKIVLSCREYFESLWACAGNDLRAELIDAWEGKIADHLTRYPGPSLGPNLGDEGADAGLPRPTATLPNAFADGEQAFVKFFGESHHRADRSTPVLKAVKNSGAHWACTYPKGKRPRQVGDGAVMFMGWLVSDPPDILVYGRAIGRRHVEGRDDATRDDIAKRSWKEKWPHYVRVHHPEFIAGTLENGVSLNELMDTLGSDSFLPTQRNAAKGSGNTNPRTAYRQQAAVELTPQAYSWLNERFQETIAAKGAIPAAEIAKLDGPDVKTPQSHSDADMGHA